MKRLVCKPAPELAINVYGGEEILLRFDVSAMARLQEIGGGLARLTHTTSREMAALIIAASNQSNIEIERARELVGHMCVQDIECIVDEYTEAICGSKRDRETEVKNALRQYLKSLTT